MSDEKTKPIFRRPKAVPVKPVDAYAEMSLEYHRAVEMKKASKPLRYGIGASELEDDFEDNSAPDWFE